MGGKDLNKERGERSQGGNGEDLGKKCLRGEREEKIFGRKMEIFLGDRPQGAMGGQDLNGKGGKRLWEEKAIKIGQNRGSDQPDSGAVSRRL